MPAKKKRRKKRQPDPVSYLVAIDDWQWRYSFGLNGGRHIDDPYPEFRHLEITGTLLKPHKVTEKADKAEIILVPSTDTNEVNRANHKPLAVGSLTLNRRILQGLLSMPMDALPPVLQALATGQMKYVLIDAFPLRYRSADVRHYSIDTSIDEDELLGDD